MSWTEELREIGREGAPPRVEARVVAAYRERPTGHLFGWAWLPALAVAAAVVLTVGAGYWRIRPVEPVAPPPVLRASSTPPEAALHKVSIIRESAIRNPQSAMEVATGFFPLRYGTDPRLLGNGALVRVRLPRAVLDSFGIPVEAERRMERIQADVLLGGDGQAHAIRFVQPAPQRVPRLTRASY
jgi:hypothetical protein